MHGAGYIMADVLLLNQYFTVRKEAPEFIAAGVPNNLLYIGSYLKDQGIPCKILELGMLDTADQGVVGDRYRCGLPDERIADLILAEKPRVVGIGCMFTRYFMDVMALAALVKRTLPGVCVVLGGNHATYFAESIVRSPDVDFVVAGEGEITFLELCREFLSGGAGFSAIAGLVYRGKDGEPVRNQPRPLIEDLDILNLDYGMIDLPRYTELSRMSPFHMRHPVATISTSRGCPNKCIYCTVRAVYGRTWRGRGAKQTVDDIQLLHEKYGIREFAFLDDSASVNKKRWTEICDEIIGRKLDIRWTTPNGIAHWTLDRELLEKMKKAGCYRITFGIESGDPEMRTYLGKPFPLDQAADLLRYANRLGMWTISTNILGFPYETLEQIKRTVRFNQRSGTDFATFYLLAPHVTTEVYKEFRKEGLLNFDPLFTGGPVDCREFERMVLTLNDSGIDTVNFTAAEMKAIQMRAYRSFVLYRAFSYLLNPLKIIRKVRSWEDFRYMTRLARSGMRILAGTFQRKNTTQLLYSNNDAE
jgi:anaerobic magnesium-protoporphyrin IX monomethyl ester cyclase